MNITLIINPKSGRGRAARVGQGVQAALERAGHVVFAEVVVRDLEIDPRSELVVLVGGDGTVHHVAPHAILCGAPIYQIPMGTENLFARQFGMTRDPEQLLSAIERQSIRRMDVAHIGVQDGSDSAEQRHAAGAAPRDRSAHEHSTAFFLMLSVGPDASVVHRLAAARTGAIGHWSYIRPIVRECFSPMLRRVTVDIDGKRAIDGRRGLLVVANSREYGVRLDPASRASETDGLLDVVFFPAESSAELVVWAMRSRLRRHVRSSRLIYETGREVDIRSEEGPMPYQLDGEAGGFVGASGGGGAGVRIGVKPGALGVLDARVPPRG